jgi:hypothetical protein
MTPARALVVGQIGSFQDCWQFRKSLARIVGTSVRTVQRAISEAKAKGLVGVARAKKGEIPPKSGRNGEPGRPLPCGWSHRWTIGWGQAGAAVQRAIEHARLRFIARASISPKGGAPRVVTPRLSSSTSTAPRRRWTAEDLDRELARQAGPMAARVARARAGPDEPD